MEKKFNVFGKIAYTNQNKRVNRVTVSVDLRTDPFDRPVLGISASIWNAQNTDIVCCGQCLDEIAKYKLEHNQDLFNFLLYMWNKYHLNDMHAGTVEQERVIRAREAEIGRKLTYEERCDYLTSIDLYEVEYHGLEFNGMYRYGHGWLYQPIDTKDLEKLIKVMKDEKAE